MARKGRKSRKSKKTAKVEKATQQVEQQPTQQAQPVEQTQQVQQVQQVQMPPQLIELLGNLASSINELKQSIESQPQMKDLAGLVMAIANDPKVAKAVGFETGVNASVITNTVERIMEGKASMQEIVSLIDNGWNIVKGYVLGDMSYKEVLEELEKKERKQAAKKVGEILDKEYS